jgi:hypothetical protein
MTMIILISAEAITIGPDHRDKQVQILATISNQRATRAELPPLSLSM